MAGKKELLKFSKEGMSWEDWFGPAGRPGPAKGLRRWEESLASTNARGTRIHANLSVDPAVADVFARSCNDCHSNRTVWPWYSGVAPVSWLVVSDVKRGRKALNLSEWGMYKAGAQQKHLAEICKEVSEGDMPVLPYKLIHLDAELTKADVGLVCEWTRSNRQNLPTVEAEVQE